MIDSSKITETNVRDIARRKELGIDEDEFNRIISGEKTAEQVSLERSRKYGSFADLIEHMIKATPPVTTPQEQRDLVTLTAMLEKMQSLAASKHY